METRNTWLIIKRGRPIAKNETGSIVAELPQAVKQVRVELQPGVYYVLGDNCETAEQVSSVGVAGEYVFERPGS